MSHSLHRSGPPQSFQDDWVVLAISAKGVNKDGSGPRLRRFLEIALRHDPVNWGDIRQGSCFSAAAEDLLARVGEESVVHAVFVDGKNMAEFLDELRRADLGISVVVSGLFEGVLRAVECACLEPHSISASLGVRGRIDRLPSPEILEVTTMCGHGLVSPNLVRDVVSRIRQGSVTSEEAGRRLARPCVCGIFNPVRAARCLEKLAGRVQDADEGPRGAFRR